MYSRFRKATFRSCGDRKATFLNPRFMKVAFLNLGVGPLAGRQVVRVA
jgi:hypothetical protein